MDELQRYVDVLFADYRQYEPAHKLRLEMLNELLLEKEKLQMEGHSEQEATHQVLCSLDELGAPSAGNVLIYIDRLVRDNRCSLLLWSLAGLVLSTPLTILGNPILSILLLVCVIAASVLYLRSYTLPAEEDVGFCDRNAYDQNTRKIWMWYGIAVLVWCVLITLLNSTSLLPTADGVWGTTAKLFRYYPALVICVLPLWASGRAASLLKNEVGADTTEQTKQMPQESESEPTDV